MSDKRELELKKAKQYLVALENTGKSLPEILIGFADQEKKECLKDVLEEVEYSKPCKEFFEHRGDDYKNYSIGFDTGWNGLLNALKNILTT